MIPATTRYAFYDLDRTITRLPTWSAFLLYAAKARAPWRLALVPAAALAAVAHKVGVMNRDRLKEVMHRLLIGGAVHAGDLSRIADAFADQQLSGNVRAGARARIAADRAAGYRVVLATAAHRFYATAIARRLGIADVIATEASSAPDGRVGYRLSGANVYGAAKLAAVTAWLGHRGEPRERQHVRFYSDHATDAPCLAVADEGFAVHPDRRLRALAHANGWPILDWMQ
ncbi:HAD-IB family hydrolase [Sphingomonas sp. HHU CXW]|uniref:HAD-IB family hydrolase n=1 Tax=Sphingomonas hominis TaxID=2741495 RepID=A0ABX2JFI8_9SPHN|nr:HAD-IB family hydrolase [Sphingomonas hominis]NTS65268.1 HAD-IB family hydrolase [Sphingomonas hominis]